MTGAVRESVIVHVPALREKPEDIELLVKFFQDEFNKKKQQKYQKQFRISTVSEMQKQLWPTNVRGLQNAVIQMMTNCETDIIDPSDFKNYLLKTQLGNWYAFRSGFKMA